MENEQIKQKIPIGMILLLIIVGSSAVSSLLTVFNNPPFQLGPIIVKGAEAVVVNLVIIGILGIIFYGILKRFRWARKLAIGWYILAMALTLINLISLLVNKTILESYSQKLLPPNAVSLMIPIITGKSVFALIIGLIIIIYLARKKDFFVN